MRRTFWRWARPGVAAAILGVLVWKVGTGPFLDGVRMVDRQSLAAAVGITGLTTVCCAWRWRLVAQGLGAAMPLRAAVAAYYRSQFLNTTLPGGVLGDVERAVRHGREARDASLGVRAVVWERLAGQVVQIALAMTVLLLLASPVRPPAPVVATVLVAGAAGSMGAVLLGRAVPRLGTSLPARTLLLVAADVRGGLLARRAWPGIVASSSVAVAGHAAIFLIAARAAGSAASPVRLLPLALLVLLAMGLPTNIAGWGPREGVAAWAFGVAGLGADQGVATAVVYGVMVLVASLPGAVVLLASRLRRGVRRPVQVVPAAMLSAAPSLEGATGG